MIEAGEYCLNCGQYQMPPWRDVLVNARACQNCQYIDERYPRGKELNSQDEKTRTSKES